MTETILAIISTLGGLELIKFLVNRKSNQRTATAEASSAEFHTLQETILFLQQQLKDKEERFAEQTQIVRRLNTEVLQLTNELSSERLAHQMDECQRKPCPIRKPKKPYTPSCDRMTMEAFFASIRETEMTEKTEQYEDN